MNPKALAQNIRRFRVAKRLSQEALADGAGLSLPAVKNLELERTKPRMRTLQAIARALDVRLEDLFLPVREPRTIRFRSAKRMRNRENILAEVSRKLDDFNYLEDILSQRIPFNLEAVRARCSRERIEEAAGLCRTQLKLNPTEPIPDLCGLLVREGIKVLPLSMGSEGFFGLSVGEEDGGPAVVVNTWNRIPVERRIFSAAHELGHLMLHNDAYDVAQVNENKEEEHEADRFAGHFLMPDEGFRVEWNEAAGLHFVNRVFKVKAFFRVSYKTVLRRLQDQGFVDKSIWQKFNIEYQHRSGRKLPFKEEPMGVSSAEPFGMQRFDFMEGRFHRLIREAVEKELISVNRGAEMLRIGIEEMYDLMRNWAVTL
jgi:Zn-dependent peptidase ImmA (M78 family)/DNA-binding XRE family transcriptional regulator